MSDTLPETERDPELAIPATHRDPELAAVPAAAPRKARRWPWVLLAALVLLAGGAFYLYRFVLKPEPTAHRHVPAGTSVALRADALKILLWKPVREHLWPLALESDGEPAESRRARLIHEKTGVRVPLERVDAIDFTDGRYTGDDSWPNDDFYDRGGVAGSLRSRTVAVYADRQWTDTGINVRAGDIIRFDPSGTIQWGPGRQDGAAGESNSPYNANRPLPNQAGGALIGRIGTSSGDMFYIGGDRGSFRARTSGRFCSHSSVSINAGKRLMPRLLEYRLTNSAASRAYLLMPCRL